MKPPCDTRNTCRSMAAFWAVGLVLSGVVAGWVAIHNQQLVAEHLQEHAARMADGVVATVSNYEKGIRGARGAILTGGQEHISRQLFGIYAQSRDIEIEFPGITGFGFIQRSGTRYILRLIEPLERNEEVGS